MQDYLFVRHDGNHCSISFSKLLYVESVKRYVRFVTVENIILTEASLYKVEQLLPTTRFCRIHRSYIVSLDHARYFNSKNVAIGSQVLPIGRHFRQNFKERVHILDNYTMASSEINDLFKPALATK